MIAVTPNFTSRNRYVIQKTIHADPMTMRRIAWLTRSELTTAPIDVSDACSAILPSEPSRPATIRPMSPSRGIWVLAPGTAVGAAEAPGLAEAPALAEGTAVAEGEGAV